MDISLSEHRLKSLMDFIERASSILPKVTAADFMEYCALQGEAIRILCNGGSKADFLRALSAIDEKFRAGQRIFYFFSLDDLRSALLLGTSNEQYTEETCDHEESHAQLIRKFRPSNSRDSPPSAIFGLFVTNPWYIFTFTGPHLPVLGLVNPFWARRHPWYIFEKWDVNTTRDLWEYLRQLTANPSEGDKLVLGL